MVKKVLEIFACRHKRISVPFPAMMAASGTATLDGKPERPLTSDHYVVCLECGKRFPYNWSRMGQVKTGVRD